MVKMFIYRYTGETTKFFWNGELYLGRKTKGGDTMVHSQQDTWEYIDSGKLTICRLKKDMEVVSTFTVPSHRIATRMRLGG